MYVPPLLAILKIIGCSEKDLEEGKRISTPASFLRLLLQIAVAHSDLNEAGYLESNPDVSDAVRRGSIESAIFHYISRGYFEGRLGALPNVDEEWYLQTYPDVSSAVRSGKIKSALEHFNVIGAAEGRSPTNQHRAESLQWKAAFKEGIK